MTKNYLIPALLSGVFSVVIGAGSAFAQSTTNTTDDDRSDSQDQAVEPYTQDKSTMDGSKNPQSGSTYERETERTNSRITINSYRDADQNQPTQSEEIPVDDDNDGRTSDVTIDEPVPTDTTVTTTTQSTDVTPLPTEQSTTTDSTVTTDASTVTTDTTTEPMTDTTGIVTETETTVQTTTTTPTRYRHARKL